MGHERNLQVALAVPCRVGAPGDGGVVAAVPDPLSGPPILKFVAGWPKYRLLGHRVFGVMLVALTAHALLAHGAGGWIGVAGLAVGVLETAFVAWLLRDPRYFVSAYAGNRAASRAFPPRNRERAPRHITNGIVMSRIVMSRIVRRIATGPRARQSGSRRGSGGVRGSPGRCSSDDPEPSDAAVAANLPSRPVIA